MLRSEIAAARGALAEPAGVLHAANGLLDPLARIELAIGLVVDHHCRVPATHGTRLINGLRRLLHDLLAGCAGV